MQEVSVVLVFIIIKRIIKKEHGKILEKYKNNKRQKVEKKTIYHIFRRRRFEGSQYTTIHFALYKKYIYNIETRDFYWR